MVPLEPKKQYFYFSAYDTAHSLEGIHKFLNYFQPTIFVVVVDFMI